MRDNCTLKSPGGSRDRHLHTVTRKSPGTNSPLDHAVKNNEKHASPPWNTRSSRTFYPRGRKGSLLLVVKGHSSTTLPTIYETCLLIPQSLALSSSKTFTLIAIAMESCVTFQHYLCTPAIRSKSNYFVMQHACLPWNCRIRSIRMSYTYIIMRTEITLIVSSAIKKWDSLLK